MILYIIDIQNYIVGSTLYYTSEYLNLHTKCVLGFNSLLASDRCKIKIFRFNYSTV